MHLDFVNELLGQYGLYAVFLLVMLEGDITLLLAGVLAHSAFFGEYSFARVLIWGTLGGCASDNLAYFTGRGFREGVREVRFYKAAKPRLERLTNKFGPLSIFLSKYIYGLRWAACVFYGVGRMPYLRPDAKSQVTLRYEDDKPVYIGRRMRRSFANGSCSSSTNGKRPIGR